MLLKLAYAIGIIKNKIDSQSLRRKKKNKIRHDLNCVTERVVIHIWIQLQMVLHYSYIYNIIVIWRFFYT
jgi:hypothetical protein